MTPDQIAKLLTYYVVSSGCVWIYEDKVYQKLVEPVLVFSTVNGAMTPLVITPNEEHPWIAEFFCGMIVVAKQHKGIRFEKKTTVAERFADGNVHTRDYLFRVVSYHVQVPFDTSNEYDDPTKPCA